jgi:GAF domain-containing protein
VHATTVASSDDRAGQVDEILDTGEVVLIEDLADDDRWAAYQMPALAHGVRSSLSLPLHGDGKVIGALNI